MDFLLASLSNAFRWYLVIAITPCINFAWRLSSDPSLLPRRLLRFLLRSLDAEVESELGSDEELSGLLPRERCPPRMRDLTPAVSRRVGLKLLSLLLGLFRRSSLLEERFLPCRDLDLRRFEFDLERDLTGLGFTLLDLLLDLERLDRELLDLLLRSLLSLLGLGVSIDWSLIPSVVTFPSGTAASSLLVTSRQVASKASVSGGSLKVTEVVYPFSTAQRNTSRP